MPNLSELTDYNPQDQVTPQGRLYVSPSIPTSDDGDYFTKPVAPMPELPADNVVERIIKKLAETDFSGGTDIGNKLTGSGGQERYQLWPEKIVRSALTAIPDAYSGKIPMNDVDPETGELVPSQAMIGRALDMASFAGVGGVAGTGEGGAVLGAGPSLRPALKYKDRLYKGKEGQQHQDVIPPHLYPEFQQMAMNGEDISHYNFGFVNDKGHFLNREDALKYGIDSGLIDPQAGKFGALTSTLMADSSKPGTAIEAMAKTAQPFYSALEHNVNAISQNKMNGEAWLGTLANKPGVKPEELDWTGLKSFLEENKGKPVTKEQVQEHLANNKVELKEVSKGELSDRDILAQSKIRQEDWDNMSQSQKELIRSGFPVDKTKYHSYQLPGGENYREMLMTLPEKINAATYNIVDKSGKVLRTTSDKTEADALAGIMPGTEVKAIAKYDTNAYKSSHWDEPNILAHVRMNDRTIDGKKSLHLEEIQSDWHQQGRDKGYVGQGVEPKGEVIHDPAGDPKFPWKIMVDGKEWNRTSGTKERALAELEDGIAAAKKRQNLVPDAPFKKTWHELALKRMLREAAEKGYDRLSWTPGEAQAARYDLSKTINKVTYDKNGTLAAYDKNSGHRVIEKQASEKELADIVGKEAADKLIKMKPDEYGNKILNNADLKIGGEGMKGFYDQIIPKAVNKLAKDYGAKVEVGKTKEGHDVFYIDLPQKLKDAAMSKGFPLFSTGVPYKFTPVDFDPFKDKKK